jgi:hypothetical protein
LIVAQMKMVLRKLESPSARRLDKYMYKKFGYRTRELRNAINGMTLHNFVDLELNGMQREAVAAHMKQQQMMGHMGGMQHPQHFLPSPQYQLRNASSDSMNLPPIYGGVANNFVDGSDRGSSVSSFYSVGSMSGLSLNNSSSTLSGLSSSSYPVHHFQPHHPTELPSSHQSTPSGASLLGAHSGMKNTLAPQYAPHSLLENTQSY